MNNSTGAEARLATLIEHVGIDKMAYAARYVFECAYDAHQQITKLFDFAAPAAIALWNLRWQVQGFLAQVPEANSDEVSSRFALKSGMRGGEIRRACVDTPWETQLEQFSNFVLINTIVIFEDFTTKLAELATDDMELQRKLSLALQFPGGAAAIVGAPSRESVDQYLKVPSNAMAGVFTRDPQTQRRYAGNKLDNLLLCYRFSNR